MALGLPCPLVEDRNAGIVSGWAIIIDLARPAAEATDVAVIEADSVGLLVLAVGVTGAGRAGR